MKARNFIGAMALVVIGIVFGAVLVSNFGWVRPSYAELNIGTETAPVQQIDPSAQAFNDAFVNVAEKVTPSIVQIRVLTKTTAQTPDIFKFFHNFRDDIPRQQQGGGSGVIISSDGYIITNNHVVENATEVEVSLYDKRKFDAEVIGLDPLTDLAVIKINADDLPAVHFGDSEKIKVGQWVMAIGNPLALTSTVTAGIISAKGRSLEIIEDNAGVEYFIQTDAAINPGNSGGALVDLSGSIIGINAAIATNGISANYIGYGFAIPINLAKAVSEDLIAHGKVSRGYIGVSIMEVDASTAKAVGLDKPQGVLIQSIVEDGAASKADVQPGDIILKIDDREVNQGNELQNYVASQRAGKTVTLEIYRDGEKIETEVTLKAPDGESVDEEKVAKKKDKAKKDADVNEKQFSKIGLTLQNLTESQYDAYNVENGVLISKVETYSEAFNQRLFSGLVIVSVDKNDIDSVTEFEKIIEEKRGDAVLLKVVDKEGNTRFVGLEIKE
jgi:serine protease Do